MKMQFWHVSTFFAKQALVENMKMSPYNALKNTCVPIFLNAVFPVSFVTCKVFMSVSVQVEEIRIFVSYIFKALIILHASHIYISWEIGIKDDS